jgi:NOL1/NOP2/fmu family ribosome biogenesis protein
MENEKLKVKNEWNIVEVESAIIKSTTYRFFPDKVKGEGFFLSCFRKTSPTENLRLKNVKPELISSKEKNIIDEWVNEKDISFIKHGREIIAMPLAILPELYIVKNALNIQYAGVRVGEIMKEKLVPHHALAVSTVITDSVPAIELTYEHAIKYLQKQDLSISPATQGWQTVSYNNFKLGWINALKNRINNYYPKELRILKQYNDTAFEN